MDESPQKQGRLEPSADDSDEYLDRDPHGWFRDQVMLHGNLNRPILLEEILRFIGCSDRKEVSAIRAEIQARTKPFRGQRRKGRPAAEKDWKWMRLALSEAWRMYALGWHWKKALEAEELKPTKTNYRTLQRRLDRLAGMMYGALPPWATGDEVKGYGYTSLEDALSKPLLQQVIHSKLRLPFRSHPDECRKVVLGLLPRGRAAYEASEIALLNRPSR
jgi:hypothetical protein